MIPTYSDMMLSPAASTTNKIPRKTVVEARSDVTTALACKIPLAAQANNGSSYWGSKLKPARTKMAALKTMKCSRKLKYGISARRAGTPVDRWLAAGPVSKRDPAPENIPPQPPIPHETESGMPERRRLVMFEEKVPYPCEGVALDQSHSQQPPHLCCERRDQKHQRNAGPDEMQSARHGIGVFAEIERIKFPETSIALAHSIHLGRATMGRLTFRT